MNLKSILYFAGLLVLAACGMEADNEPNEPKTDTLACTEMASYEVTFNAAWSAATHPTDFPNNPHFSGLIGATHNAETHLWQKGVQASAGIQSMAETGSKNPLDSEIDAAITAAGAETKLSDGGVGTSPGNVKIDSFDISQGYSRVSLVTMIAPSPDWFVGIDSLNLCENDKWVNEKKVDLFAYDAGTDSGTSFTSPNQATVQQEPISKLETSPFDNGTPLGNFTFIRK